MASFQVFSIGITLVDVLQNWLNCFYLLFPEGDLLVILIDCMIFLSPFLDVTRMSIDVLQNWLSWFHFHFLDGDLLVILIDCIIFLSPFLDVTRMSMPTVPFLT